MALFILSPGVQPLGMFDLKDGVAPKGGELMTFDKVRVGDAYDVGAQDVMDAYVAGSWDRPYVVLADNTTELVPMYLSDDGTNFYGVLFGTVIGGNVGTVTGKGSSTATNLGPASYVGSGKVTLWDKPGLYAVSLDNVDSSLNTLATPVPGAPLYVSTTGLLTTTPGASIVGQFIELTNSGGMVQTPSRLFAAGTPTLAMFDRLVFQYTGAQTIDAEI